MPSDNREWALSDDGKVLIELIMQKTGITDREQALRLAEDMVITEELYADLRTE